MIKVISIMFLTFSVMASAIAVIYSKHSNRKLFVELEQINKNIDELNTNWGRLQLEEGAWSDHGRIEEVAAKNLNMVLPSIEAVVYLKP